MPTPSIPLQHQISESLRERLLRGEWEPGDRLPTMEALAAEYNTSYFTVHAAMTPLVEDGWLARKRRVGTVVLHNPAALRCAGIYLPGFGDAWDYAFYRELCAQLQLQLGEQQVRSDVIVDTRSADALTTPLPALVDAVREHRIQGLLVPLCDRHNLPWLRQLPVAASFTSSARIPNAVHADGAQLIRVALGQLAARGCRTIGLISSITSRHDFESKQFRFYEQFVAALGELGLTTRDAWVRTPKAHVSDLETYGYEAFRSLWSQSEHPDGLLVYPDISARGVMTAALQLGVDPEQLRMVFHRNSGVDWLCPLPVDWLETDVAAWAAAMIRQVRQQKAGQPLTDRIDIPAFIR